MVAPNLATFQLNILPPTVFGKECSKLTALFFVLLANKLVVDAFLAYKLSMESQSICILI